MLAQKLQDLRARRAAGETGFTLVELLVVVVIIVALAAIAVPIFLNQKDKADESAIKSSLASAAKFVSAGVAQGDLAIKATPTATTTTPVNPSSIQSLPQGTILVSASGTFTLSAPMSGAVDAKTGSFCIDSGNGAGTYGISNTSGGVQLGSCTDATATFTPAVAPTPSGS